MSKPKYEKSFFIRLNMQNPPNPEYQHWYVRKADESSVEEYTVLGWEFTLDLRKDSIGEIEGKSPKLNFRKSFLPEEGHYLVSRDYSGQELRILANLSGEPGWIETFKKDGDIHKQTAISIWGEEHYDDKKRDWAKSVNFGLVYGTTAVGLSKNIGVTIDQAQAIIDTFYDNNKYIGRYLERQAREAQKNSELQNHYGRKRRFHNNVTPYGELDPSGTRQSYNFPIQSMGADITKLGILNVYYNIIKNEKYEGKALWMSTIHDEINLSIRKDIIEEAVRDMGLAMEHTLLPDMPVPITSGLSIGTSMGLLWEFNQDPETLKLTPAFEELSEESKERLKQL